MRTSTPAKAPSLRGRRLLGDSTLSVHFPPLHPEPRAKSMGRYVWTLAVWNDVGLLQLCVDKTLTRGPDSNISQINDLSGGGHASDIPVTVGSRWYNPRFHGRLFGEIRKGYFFLVTPGWDITPVVINAIARKDDRTLVVDTGVLQYGKVSLTFDSTEDANQVEWRLRDMLNVLKNRETRKIP